MSGQLPGVGNTGQEFVSPGTRFVADEKKATVVPATSMAGSVLARLPCSPLLLTLTRTVVPAARLRTKTSGQTPGTSSKKGGQVLVSPSTRLLAIESKVTRLPSPLMPGSKVVPPR